MATRVIGLFRAVVFCVAMVGPQTTPFRDRMATQNAISRNRPITRVAMAPDAVPVLRQCPKASLTLPDRLYSLRRFLRPPDRGFQAVAEALVDVRQL